MKTIIATLILCGLINQSDDCTLATIDDGANVNFTCDGSIQLNGKIDGRSQAVLTSNTGNIYITEKIDGKSVVTLRAGGQCTIGWVIDGNSTVSIRCNGNVEVKDKIDGASHCDFYSESGDIIIGGKVDNDATSIRWHGRSLTIKGSKNPKCQITQY